MNATLLDTLITPVVMLHDDLTLAYVNPEAMALCTQPYEAATPFFEVFPFSKQNADLAALLLRLSHALLEAQCSDILGCCLAGKKGRYTLRVTRLAPSMGLMVQIVVPQQAGAQRVSYFNISPVAMMWTDSHDIIQAVNPAFEAMFGYAQADLLGRTPAFLRDGLDEQTTLEAMWKAVVDEGHWKGEVHHRRQDGEVLTTQLSLSAISHDHCATTYLSFFTDISHHFEQIKQLKARAYQDYLTELPNRFALDDTIYELILTQSYFYLIFIDLGYFKQINDNYGHLVGDRLLHAVGQRLHQLDRAFVCRYGGDEFIVLLPISAQPSDVDTAFSSPFLIDGQAISVIAHKGVAQYPRDGYTSEALIRYADKSMYKMKSSGFRS
ncbi:sensor domain-containing diguanylate cyclase [Salinivibrio costicola]|uniref:Diguanylate cyclase n=1 Tax=Salinivibrio costicola TaxID=51367 RepID=A0ABX6K9A7_SALCS|nr:sensor domain-containing diguanylate cyclase [Salinivibrio costicola]QIR08059.1 diguanylate cyclase [Salinivibrio costicola]